MAKSYNRRFRKNGLSFMVQDTHPADRKTDTDKYYLTVNQNGIYKIVYDNITWEMSVKEKCVQKDWLLSHSSQPERMVNDYENRYCYLQ